MCSNFPENTPSPIGAEASSDGAGSWSRVHSTLDAYRTQTLVLAHCVRPEWAAMLAALAFDGGAQ